VIEQISTQDYKGDVLLVAGDIADSLEVIGDTFMLLERRFSKIFYVPGNHELWVRSGEYDSVEKLHMLLELCDRLGVHTQPGRAGGLWVVPLLSWYDTEGDAGRATPGLEGWADFHYCKWPADMTSVSDFFLQRDVSKLGRYDGGVITLSHFLPRADLLPDVSWLRFKALPKVAVCSRLDARLRALNPLAHVFGHSHINWDQVIDGVRYVQNALRYPRERLHSDFPLKQVWPPDESSGGRR
jgi:hypothetical protein